ncbi:hypothetical protein [Streptomyces sp. Ac-502]|uniref:hypothetical protein n=1 Tax=Streptomyces sp. Ac-502 TaxID=3342801 RepID=UPI003862C13F
MLRPHRLELGGLGDLVTLFALPLRSVRAGPAVRSRLPMRTGLLVLSGLPVRPRLSGLPVRPRLSGLLLPEVLGLRRRVGVLRPVVVRALAAVRVDRRLLSVRVVRGTPWEASHPPPYCCWTGG